MPVNNQGKSFFGSPIYHAIAKVYSPLLLLSKCSLVRWSMSDLFALVRIAFMSAWRGGGGSRTVRVC
jgi:hypothetical protein